MNQTEQPSLRAIGTKLPDTLSVESTFQTDIGGMQHPDFKSIAVFPLQVMLGEITHQYLTGLQI